MKILVFVFSLLFLPGCATLSREDCARGDWAGIGYRDGRSGETNGRVTEHQKACADYGIVINTQQYHAGREQGLIEYCKLENAFASGLNGHEYQYVCPSVIDATFKRYNSAAFKVYDDRSNLKKIEDELSSKENSLSNKKLSDNDRQRIHNEIRSLDRKRDSLRDQLYSHEQTLDDYRNEARARRY